MSPITATPTGSTAGVMKAPSNLMGVVGEGMMKGIGGMGADMAMNVYQGPQVEEYAYSPQSPSSRNLYNYNIV